jgi:hypothetical protein
VVQDPIGMRKATGMGRWLILGLITILMLAEVLLGAVISPA